MIEGTNDTLNAPDLMVKICRVSIRKTVKLNINLSVTTTATGLTVNDQENRLANLLGIFGHLFKIKEREFNQSKSEFLLKECPAKRVRNAQFAGNKNQSGKLC